MQNERGQTSIFFSTVVIVMITFLAFIINIGIFVKAKINLQNATDAAAYAGASVQARQLTNIGYVNWAMRNVFKEWMFKYYVLGGLNLETVSDQVLPTPPNSQPCEAKQGGVMDFTMACYKRTSAGGEDQYNFPSTCMDFANTGGVGLCTRFLVPGLPRFNQQNVLGMDETTNAFIDSIVSEKSRDCSDRTELNFLTNNIWAYNVTLVADDTLQNISADAPEIAVNFMGAFPQAFELGLRIRNLESEVNFPPQNGVCGDPGAGIDCNITANELTTPHQERALKAYLSGWRNLGSGNDREMKDSFTLTEIPPKLPADLGNSLSDLLIPPAAQQARNKYYVDLKLITANYATFYTSFATSQGDIEVGGATISAEGQCASTKIGLPVPGYPLHFVKNPDVLTYYAVEGKAKFVGLFNPFESDFITLKAYAAAKPFGGRIGPMIFDVSDRNIIKARTARKSSPWISALNTASFLDLRGNANPGRYSPGKPIPINAGTGKDQFWMTSPSDNIGGFIADGNEIFFGIPNMIYDYPNSSITNNQSYYASEQIQIIGYKRDSPAPTGGLYNREMFRKFKTKLRNLGGVVRTEDINDALTAISAPTLWEAHNFMIPTPEDVNKALKTDSFGAIDGVPERTINIPNDETHKTYKVYDAILYAPLYNPDNQFSIFNSQTDLKNVLADYLQRQEPAILKYKSSMNMVAADIFTQNFSGATGQNTGAQAARVISDLTNNEYRANLNAIKDAKPSCASIAGRFVYFYSGNGDLVKNPESGCPTPLPILLESRWANQDLTGNYAFKYALPDDVNFQRRLFSAYQPGAFRAAQNGSQRNPVTGVTRNRFRNSYSTKFIPVQSVSSSDNATFSDNDLMLIYSEGAPKTAPIEIKRAEMKNPLQPAEVGIDLSRVQH